MASPNYIDRGLEEFSIAVTVPENGEAIISDKTLCDFAGVMSPDLLNVTQVDLETATNSTGKIVCLNVGNEKTDSLKTTRGGVGIANGNKHHFIISPTTTHKQSIDLADKDLGNAEKQEAIIHRELNFGKTAAEFRKGETSAYFGTAHQKITVGKGDDRRDCFVVQTNHEKDSVSKYINHHMNKKDGTNHEILSNYADAEIKCNEETGETFMEMDEEDYKTISEDVKRDLQLSGTFGNMMRITTGCMDHEHPTNDGNVVVIAPSSTFEPKKGDTLVNIDDINLDPKEHCDVAEHIATLGLTDDKKSQSAYQKYRREIDQHPNKKEIRSKLARTYLNLSSSTSKTAKKTQADDIVSAIRRNQTNEGGKVTAVLKFHRTPVARVLDENCEDLSLTKAKFMSEPEPEDEESESDIEVDDEQEDDDRTHVLKKLFK